MKCPHCLQHFHESWTGYNLGGDIDFSLTLLQATCASCNRFILRLLKVDTNKHPRDTIEIPVYPVGISRSPLPSEVPGNFAADYKDACIVLPYSPKASAALSRRCLQHLLREVAKVKHSDLSKEIDELLSSKALPSHLLDAVDAIRNIGNFSAHPMKSTHSGEILEVEPGEAEWLLDILEGLFDFYFVQPEILRRKREALNEKLKSAGKPPLKTA